MSQPYIICSTSPTTRVHVIPTTSKSTICLTSRPTKTDSHAHRCVALLNDCSALDNTLNEAWTRFRVHLRSLLSDFSTDNRAFNKQLEYVAE